MCCLSIHKSSAWKLWVLILAETICWGLLPAIFLQSSAHSPQDMLLVWHFWQLYLLRITFYVSSLSHVIYVCNKTKMCTFRIIRAVNTVLLQHNYHYVKPLKKYFNMCFKDRKIKLLLHQKNYLYNLLIYNKIK